MDKITKALKKFSSKEKENIKAILIKINNNNFNDLDIKKLQNREDIYRIRKGKIRIIYRFNANNKIIILTIERRSDNTYNS